MSLCGAVAVLLIRSIGSGTYSRMSGAKTLTKLIPRCIYISNSLHALCRKCKLSLYLYSPGHPCAYIKELWDHILFFMHPYFEVDGLYIDQCEPMILYRLRDSGAKSLYLTKY